MLLHFVRLHVQDPSSYQNCYFVCSSTGKRGHYIEEGALVRWQGIQAGMSELRIEAAGDSHLVEELQVHEQGGAQGNAIHGHI